MLKNHVDYLSGIALHNPYQNAIYFIITNEKDILIDTAINEWEYTHDISKNIILYINALS